MSEDSSPPPSSSLPPARPASPPPPPMAFILDPHAEARAMEAATDRFVSMSVTRNAAATVGEPPRPVTLRATMRVDDIEGARPKALPPWQRANFHETLDIEGAQPRPLHVEKRNHPALALTNADIEESAPRATRFRSRREVNPIDPAYTLPRAEPLAPPEPRFKRDLHQVADIAGTASNGFLRWSSRESMQLADIEGTSSRPRCVIVQGPNMHSFAGTASQGLHADSLRVKDINVEGIVPNGFHSKRRESVGRGCGTARPRCLAAAASGRGCGPRAAG